MERETKTMKNEEIRDKSGGHNGGRGPGDPGTRGITEFSPERNLLETRRWC